MDAQEPAVTTMLLAGVKNEEKLDSDVTDVVALFKKKNQMVHMCVGIVSNTLRQAVSVFNTSPVEK